MIQATVGCPHNRCTFCMVYKNGPRFRVRDVEKIRADLLEGKAVCGPGVRTLFFPAGNTIAMKTGDLGRICRFSRALFPDLERITVYGSSQYIHQKGPERLRRLAESGLSRIHVGLESGDDEILKRIRKGTFSRQQIEAGRFVAAAGIELNVYVLLGIGGRERTVRHAAETARVLNAIGPDVIRLRTFVPKINTPMLEAVRSGEFRMLGPHGILKETRRLIEGIRVAARLTSDHYTNYIRLEGDLPRDKDRLLATIDQFRCRDESRFRPFFIGTE